MKWRERPIEWQGNEKPDSSSNPVSNRYPCWELNPGLSLRRAALYPLSYRGISSCSGGETGIRTLGAVLPAQPLSRRLRSSTPASPRTICLQGGGRGIRTPGNHKGYSGFQDRRLKPLGHPSVFVMATQGESSVNARESIPPRRRAVNCATCLECVSSRALRREWGSTVRHRYAGRHCLR